MVTKRGLHGDVLGGKRGTVGGITVLMYRFAIGTVVSWQNYRMKLSVPPRRTTLHNALIDSAGFTAEL